MKKRIEDLSKSKTQKAKLISNVISNNTPMKKETYTYRSLLINIGLVFCLALLSFPQIGLAQLGGCPGTNDIDCTEGELCNDVEETIKKMEEAVNTVLDA